MDPSDLPLPLTSRRPAYGIYFEPEPRYAKVSGIVVSVLASSACASFFLFRFAQVKSWRSLAWTTWILLAIYFDSYLFVMASAVLHFSFSLNEYHSLCEAATLLCLLAYLSSKYTVWGSGVPRYKSKPYLIHFAILTGALFACWIILIIFRFSRLENGLCIIGIQQSVMIGPLAVDVVCNAYLTAVFTFPIYRYTTKRPERAAPTVASSNTRSRNERLLRVAKKSFVGCILTLGSSIANLLALMLLDGEPAWLCLLCCKIDVLFNAVVLFWVTRTDSLDIAHSSRSKSDSARSRVTRLSFYTGWIRANMGQGPHPGRPFIIPQTPTSPLMGGGTDGNNSAERGGGGGGAGTSSVGHNNNNNNSSNSKGGDRRAVINATATTAAPAPAPAESSKAPTRSILKTAGTGTTDTVAAARSAYESSTEIWTGPDGHATEAAGLGISETRFDNDKEELGTDPQSETSGTTTSTSDTGR
ncbi:hypothetical protein PG997_011452 [Apiospora hydei]|uniref:Uncharacterized protein n=1 Tax=Apiospora hydei TaxID=1337664 RepID=A0ABR1VJ36_9PEZI